MAATNPFRLKDLVRKYGWDFLAYTPALGKKLCEAQVLFVDSGNSNALDSDDSVHGHSFEYPLATIDYAVGLCTASESSVVLVAPGHAETVSTAATLITADIAGISIIGIGDGAQRPTLTITHGSGVALSVTAASVTAQNILVYNNVDATVKAVSLAAADCTLEDVEIRDAANNKEAAIGILTTSAAERLKIKNFRHVGWVDGNGCTESIRLDGLNDADITNCTFYGAFSTGAVNMYDTACAGVRVKSCRFRNGTTALTKNVVDTATGSKWMVEDCFDEVGGYGFSGGDGAALAADDVSAVAAAVAGITNSVTAAVANPPVTNSLQDILHKDGTYTYDNTSDSLEAIADAIKLAIGSPAAGSIADIIKKLHYVADGTDVYPATVVADSVLAKIMAKGDPAAITTFNNTTDSLEALSDAVGAITSGVSSAVAATPTPSSLQDVLQKDATQDYNRATDSLEAVSDKAGGFSGDGGAAQDDSIKASLDLVHTDIDAILADTITISGGALPASPTAGSVARYLASGGTALGTELPDSMSLYDIVKTIVSLADGGSHLYPDSVVQDSVLAYILSKANPAVTTSFDNSTDSLEAIADALAAGTGCTTALGTEALNHLVHMASGGTHVYPDSVATDTILAYMMVKADPAVITTFDNSTDSLEAIADALVAGTGCTTALATAALNHIAQAADGGTHVYPDSVATDSMLAYIMVKADPAVITTFDNSTDSLEAIADRDITILADTIQIADGALPASPTANSLARFIASGGTALGTQLADSKSLIDALGATGSTSVLDECRITSVKKNIATIANGNNNLFTVSGGPVKLIEIIGFITTAVQAQATNIKLVMSATGGGTTDMCAVLDATGAAQYKLLTITGTFANAMVLSSTTGCKAGSQAAAAIVTPGTIVLNSDAASSGVIDWYVSYQPMATGAKIAPA